MEIKPIDQMPHLSARLGKAGTDRIRYHQQGTGLKHKGMANIENILIGAMQDRAPSDYNCSVNDILCGVARSDASGVQKPLSVKRLYTVLQCMPNINSKEIGLMMNLEPRQARRYMAALKTAWPFLVRVLPPNKDKAA
jgi:hypothetical protein